MEAEKFHVLTAEFEKLTLNPRSILVDRLHRIEHAIGITRRPINLAVGIRVVGKAC